MFIHLGFLAAGLAIAVPIAIHLLLRPRAQRRDIGTLRFLKIVLKDSTRRKRVRRWLLLALRALAVLLLALLFARPYWTALGGPGHERELFVLIDQSASMSAIQGGQTLFAQAQASADALLRRQPEGTLVHLAYCDAEGVEAPEKAQVDLELKPTFAGTDHGLALCWARDLLLQSSRKERRVVLFSDLQKTGMGRTTCAGFPADVPVELVEAGRTLVGNHSVESVEAPQPLLKPGEPVLILASIRNAGAFPVREVKLRLALKSEGQPDLVQTQSTTIGPGAVQVVEFKPAITKPGIWSGQVDILRDDEFPLDNRRYVAFEARPADRILVVDGEPGPSVYGHETYFLEAALRLKGLDQKEAVTAYEPERLPWERGAALPDLTPFRVVILCNVPELDQAAATRLRQFVAGGGRLLIFTGKRVDASSLAELGKLGLLPAQVEGPSEAAAFRFGVWERGHPIFKPLSDPQQGDLRKLTFFQITRLKPTTQAKVLAATPENEPLLIEGRYEDGVVLLFAVGADRDWSDWPKTPLYVPLVHQLVGYLTERLPENQRVQVVAVSHDNPPGILVEGRTTFVRNLDPTESTLGRLTPEEFRKAYELTATVAGSEPSSVAEGDSERPDELWTYVAWFLLGLLVVELFVANRTAA